MTPDHTPAAAPSGEAVATVFECEACFTPDACRLRGTCDHYAASKLRIAAAPSAPAPAEVPMPEPDACPMCAGEGSVRSHTTHLGPDDYDYDENCPACYGTGSADMADAINALGYWEHRTDITRFVVERAAVLRIVEARSAYAAAREAAERERVRGVLRNLDNALRLAEQTAVFGEMLRNFESAVPGYKQARAAARAELGEKP